jgi:hypothetical protein
VKVNSLTITIDNFDNAAMVDDPNFEVSQMLRALSNLIRSNGVSDCCEHASLRDSNGNTVGKVVVVFDESEEDEDGDDYDATQDENSEDY